MPRKPLSVPTYRFHKASGQAFIEIRGSRRYLGKYDSEESREAYGRIITELAVKPVPAVSPLPIPTGQPMLVTQLAAAYWEFAERYYVKEGQPTSEVHVIRAALRLVRQLYSHVPLIDFGPLSLRAIQVRLIDRGKARSTINGENGYPLDSSCH